ncbi:DNA polymerase epsilon noncatalytic subunit SCDLUD_001712 [Saccharomycodes ludwigii]|uniref:DNA polymerase epsilon noncatalytic subunit n=1 Tax=Saccharomycodes ludwigii TaxID=36035 RepID=UPI001E85650C|nr:hypothetical protein SCDLUD_001712 [Saccharomycodes ludwigii]KAH3901927.1 hypothetical protein SCDLUD_001712 [Saccharomycodes ludwigii]
MPPKGWRKDSSGNYPQKSYAKEQQQISINDLLFPKATIVSLAKKYMKKETAIQGQEDAHDDDAPRKLIMSKDSTLALQRSATVFVNYLLIHARAFALNKNKKSISADDIRSALEEIGFGGGFVDICDELLDKYNETVNDKKLLKQKEKETVGNNGEEEEGEKEEGEEKEEEGEKEAEEQNEKERKSNDIDENHEEDGNSSDSSKKPRLS